MPCIQTKVNVSLTDEQEKSMKKRMGEAISIIPGKSESWLMVELEGDKHMFFKGKNDRPIAFAAISSYGSVDPSSASALTAKICDILEKELGVPKDNIYVRYAETDLWGWNGRNF